MPAPRQILAHPMDDQEALAEPTQQQRIKTLFDKATGPGCAQLTTDEAHELSRHHKIAPVRKVPGRKEPVKTRLQKTTGTKQYGCCFCLMLHNECRTFERESSLQRHYRAHLRCFEECPACGKHFAYMESLRRHQAKTHPNTPRSSFA